MPAMEDDEVTEARCGKEEEEERSCHPHSLPQRKAMFSLCIPSKSSTPPPPPPFSSSPRSFLIPHCFAADGKQLHAKVTTSVQRVYVLNVVLLVPFFVGLCDDMLFILPTPISSFLLYFLSVWQMALPPKQA